MKFQRVLGKIDKDIVEKCRRKMTDAFLELASRPSNSVVASAIGGDPLVFTLVGPAQHLLTEAIPTACTDGRRFYWNPHYLLKKSPAGLRILLAHEALHAHFMHPSRVGKRHKKLWNFVVDWMVHDFILEDFKFKKVSPSAGDFFEKHMGPYITVNKYIDYITNPTKSQTEGLDLVRLWKQEKDRQDLDIPDMPAFDEDKELTPEQREAILKKAEKIRYLFADPEIPKELKRAEKLYEYIWQKMPRCPKCERVGFWYPKTRDDVEVTIQKEWDDHEKHGKGCDLCTKPPAPPGSGDNPSDSDQDFAPNYGEDGINVLDNGDTLDEHVDSDETPEESAKRLNRAMENARRMGGSVPGGLEDELGVLTAPVITWRDLIRSMIKKYRDGKSRNDWTRFKARQIFAGLLVPKKSNGVVTFGCLLDTSGSMSNDQMALGVSQLASLDAKAEGWVVPADADVYWDKTMKIRNPSVGELIKVKAFGRGGTMFAKFFDEYQKYMGKCDFLIIITDGGLFDMEQMKNPGIEVVWLVTSPHLFTPPFGRVMQLAL